MLPIPKLWSISDVSEYLGVPVATLYQWRHQGYGPIGKRVGRYVRYDPNEVRKWFETLDSKAS
jgi:predicted DNA-binding transcriptional regulator AlpA